MRWSVAASVVSALVLASCSADPNQAEQAADRLAAALAAGRIPASQFGTAAASAQREYDTIVSGLGKNKPAVAVTSVTAEGNRAEATLRWSWRLAGNRWRYDARAALRKTSRGWVAQWDPRLVQPALGDGERLVATTLTAPRGRILGAGRSVIVKDRPVVRFGIDKTQVRPSRAVASARRLARLLDVDAAAFARAVRAAGPEAFVEAIVLRPADARAVDPSYSTIPGATALRAALPLAPTREFAAEILGRVGPATADLIEQSDGRLQAGDLTGVSGLQQRYDEQLSGSPGVEVEAVGGSGSTRRLFRAAPVAGKPLRTTLAPRLQLKAERVLADQPGTAAMVVIRPSTGDILVAANAPASNGLNAATYGRYAPGSTFKLVSSLALLRSGLTPRSVGDCPPSIVVAGKRFKNYSDYPADRLGRITMRQAVANSCNTFFVGSARRLKRTALADAAAALGLGVDYDVGFPAYFGQVPPPSGRTEAAADMIGQGKVLASPMAMAAVAASIEAGRTVVPHLLQGYEPDPRAARPLSRAEAAQLRSIMRTVVTQGSGAVLAGLGGGVGAKTGTAQYGQPGPGGVLPTHAWMLAVRGDLAVAAFVENGESGSQTAGPLILRLLG